MLGEARGSHGKELPLPTLLPSLSCVFFMALGVRLDSADCPHFPEGETEALRGSSSLWVFSSQGWAGNAGCWNGVPKALWNSYIYL